MARKNELTNITDKAIGDKIAKLRRSMGLSRQQIADTVDASSQQIAKWESGVNRISVGRMPLIAKALKKSISYFFEDLDIPYEAQTLHQRMTIEVARNFALIKNPGHQSVIHSMVREFAKNS